MRRWTVGVRRMLATAILATAMAAPAHADTFRVRASGDLDWSPTAGAVDITGPGAVSAAGALSDSHGSAPYSLSAGPGVVRDKLAGSFTNPRSFTLRFNPTTSAAAEQELTIHGPPGFVTTSLNVHVDGFMQHACESMRACQSDAQISVRVATRNQLTAFGTRSGMAANQLGLSVTPSDDGFRLHGDVATTPVTLAVNRPFVVRLGLSVKATHLGDGSTATSRWSADFGGTVSFSPVGPVLNLPPGYSASGAGVVDNRWRDPSDGVAPVVTGVPDREPDENGWYRGPVTIDWQSIDPEPSSGSPTDPPDTLADEEGEAVLYESEPSCDPAGNCARGGLALSIDRTPPTVACQTPEPVFLLGEAGAEVRAEVADDLSGPVTGEVSAAADTRAVGSRSAALTGRDVAGNETRVECPYRVEYRFEGFGPPVFGPPAINRVNAGRTVPLAWRLTDASGAPVTGLARAELTAVALACDLGDTPDEPAERPPGRSDLQYLGDGRYRLNWKTPAAYAGSCKTLRLDLGEGAYRTALFRFRP